jgi:predicted amidophosphoribosyltransferase
VIEGIRLVASLLAPPLCAACGRACDWRHPLCGACDRRLRRSQPVCDPAPPGLDVAWAVGPYDGICGELVAALKFRRLLPVARRIAEAIALAAPPELLGGTLVAVPPAPRRLAWRGFDPAEEIAVALARIQGLPLARSLTRGDGPPQVGRPRTDRIRRPPRVEAVAPARDVVLVDDVQTTGATLAACAAALRAAGSARVVAVTAARALWASEVWFGGSRLRA